MRRRAAAPSLSERLTLLEEVLALGELRLQPESLARARAAMAHADQRLVRGDQLVVAALAGGTGTGKSSLFNAVAGRELAEVGVRRPTTDAPHAWVCDTQDASGPLLDWLGVRHRHQATEPPVDGLVLLDLPDHDSVVTAHRGTVDTLIERVDLLLWVVDPLKYAQRALHDTYLRRLAHHAEVVVVVLNRVDELSPDGREACLDDLRRLLDAEDLEPARVLATSARTGEGVDVLRTLLIEEAAARRAAAQRIAGDLRAVAADMADELGAAAEGLPEGPGLGDDLSDALAGAAGIGGIAASTEDEYQALALEGTRPLVSRGAAAVTGLARRSVRGLRSLLPVRERTRPLRPTAHASPVTVRHAVLELVERSAGALPSSWRVRLRTLAGAGSGDLTQHVTAAVDGVPLRPPRRRWWRPTALALSLAELAALAGFGWLLALAVLSWLQLPALGVPRAVGELPWPTALLLGGLVLRAAGGVGRRRAIAAGAARHAREVAARLRRAVADVAAERVLGPLRAELDAHARLRELLGRIAA